MRAPMGGTPLESLVGKCWSFPASRGLSRRGKNERKGRGLCWLPKHFLSHMRLCFLNNHWRFCHVRHNPQNRFARETSRGVKNSTISQIWGKRGRPLNQVTIQNKTLLERIFGRGRTTRMILLTCVIAAKQLSSYPTRENKSFTLYYFFAKPYSLCSVFLSVHGNVLICPQPNCNIGHQCLQPGQ